VFQASDVFAVVLIVNFPFISEPQSVAQFSDRRSLAGSVVTGIQHFELERSFLLKRCT